MRIFYCNSGLATSLILATCFILTSTSTVVAQWEPDFPEFLNHTELSGTRDQLLLPAFQQDSTYDPVTQQWNYLQDAVHYRYHDSCLDSMVTFSENGVNSKRIFYQWNELGFTSDELTQTWASNEWIDQSDWQSHYLYNNCHLDYEITRTFNGVSWDTTYYVKQDLVFNNLGLPIERTQYKYSGGIMKPSLKHELEYNTLGQLTSDSYYTWNETAGSFEPQWRVLVLSFLDNSSICTIGKSSLLLRQVYTNGWANSTKDSACITASGNINVYKSSWNGYKYTLYALTKDSVFDQFGSYMTIRYSYSFGNWYRSDSSVYLKDLTGRIYSILLYEWWNDQWEFWYGLESKNWFGPNGEILKSQYSNLNCDPDVKVLTPCNLSHFSDFQWCDALDPVEEPDTLNAAISIYPNPAAAWVTINKCPEVEIISVEGKIFYENEKTSGTVTINVTNWPNGIYICKTGSTFSRMIIQH